MLQKLADPIANCLVRAAQAERRAAEASSEAMRIDNEQMAKTWRLLASSYQFVESLERFLLDCANARSAHPPGSAGEREAAISPLRGAIFDPKTIAVLTAAYDQAIEGQPASIREVNAKRIIQLAARGNATSTSSAGVL